MRERRGRPLSVEIRHQRQLELPLHVKTSESAHVHVQQVLSRVDVPSLGFSCSVSSATGEVFLVRSLRDSYSYQSATRLLHCRQTRGNSAVASLSVGKHGNAKACQDILGLWRLTLSTKCVPCTTQPQGQSVGRRRSLGQCDQGVTSAVHLGGNDARGRAAGRRWGGGRKGPKCGSRRGAQLPEGPLGSARR